MKIEGGRIERRSGEKTRKVIRWDEEGERNIRNVLERRSKSWKELKDKIIAALPTMEIKIRERVIVGNQERIKSTQGWRRKRKEYRNLIEEKKRKKAKSWLEEIEIDKSMKTFWKEIVKKAKEPVDKAITNDQCKEHFRRQYVKEVDEITIEKISETINGLKSGKAPGQDEITNEAWKKGRDLIKEELKATLKGI